MSTLKDDMPTVLIAGGSGLIGRYLTNHFKTLGYRVFLLTRKPTRKEHIFWNPENGVIHTEELDKIDILVNLVGENIGSKRWTPKRKAQIITSRVHSTHFLASVVPQMPNLKYYLGASGVNCYENIPGKIFSETDAYGTDFLATVVKEWEAAHQLVLAKVKGCMLRISMVLTPQGGSLHLMKQPILLGIGAAIGSGAQVTPWIHIADLCALTEFAISQQIEGTYNALGNCNSNQEMTKLLAKWLRRPLFLPNIPAFILHLLLGERSTLVLSDLRASNEKIRQKGFSFAHDSLDATFETFFMKR